MAGLPVLASNLAGLKYVLNAHMGIVVENFRDPDQLEEAVLQIGAWKKEDYLPHLHEAALQYNWENQETVLLNVYHSLYESR
ncbi:MAG: hypothetical protein IPJ40_10340 [Saprospirales bacterium]|nr:hypothetical protein [Saprospirales bacterium]